MKDGVEIERLTGDMITETHWDHFYRFYIDTGNRKWGRLTSLDLFSHIGETMSDRVRRVCRADGRYSAGAINFVVTNASSDLGGV